MRKITRADRLRYWFDNTLSRGPIALIGWLFLISAAIVIIISLSISISGIGPADQNGKPLGLRGIAWIGLLSTLDTGEIENVAGGTGFLGLVLVTTFGGIFLASILIGILTTSITDRLDALRKGRSFVVEEHHIVILGWSPHVFAILSELVTANANQRRAVIVILAERDKVEMEDEIRSRIGKTGSTRIICRTGSPIDLTELEIVNPHSARAIVIPSPESYDPDTHVIKTILALTNNPKRREEPYHIVAEIQDRRNLEVARLVGRDEVRLILADELIARIVAQTCRQSGLSVVYTELLDFAGDEIYFQEEPQLAGRSFGEALFAYEDSAIIGLRRGDGQVMLNPPMDTLIAEGDKVIAISEDDDTVRVSSSADQPIDAAAIRQPAPTKPVPERTLILGWNAGAPTIINELDHYVPAGSVVLVVAELADGEARIHAECNELRNQEVRFQEGDTTDRRLLDTLDVNQYDHVITLSNTAIPEPQAADARTLVTLLHLRDIVSASEQPVSIVSEMLDVRNRQLAEVTRADDFIVSDMLVSLMLAQIAENRELHAVFIDLFDADGSEIYLKPAGDYVEPNHPLTFYTVVEAARRRGEIAIGYRQREHANNAALNYGVHVNPKKSELLSLAEADRIIVLAAD